MTYPDSISLLGPVPAGSYDANDQFTPSSDAAALLWTGWVDLQQGGLRLLRNASGDADEADRYVAFFRADDWPAVLPLLANDLAVRTAFGDARISMIGHKTRCIELDYAD